MGLGWASCTPREDGQCLDTLLVIRGDALLTSREQSPEMLFPGGSVLSSIGYTDRAVSVVIISPCFFVCGWLKSDQVLFRSGRVHVEVPASGIRVRS